MYTESETKLYCTKYTILNKSLLYGFEILNIFMYIRSQFPSRLNFESSRFSFEKFCQIQWITQITVKMSRKESGDLNKD